MSFIVVTSSAISSDDDGTGTRSCSECDPIVVTRDVTASPRDAAPVRRATTPTRR